MTVCAATPKFSLQDEAKWNSSHRTGAYDAGKKLRNLPIQFVSAGQLEGTIKERPRPVQSSDSESKSATPSSPSSTQENTDAMAHMAIRSPSPDPSIASSSSDEVVFQGRGGAPAAASSMPPPSRSLSTSANQTSAKAPAQRRVDAARAPTPQLMVASTDDHASVAGIDAEATINFSIRVKAEAAPADDDVDSDANEFVQDHFAKRRGGKPAWEGTTTPWQHRSKPNIGWLPVADRPDMDAFLRGEVKPRDAAMDDYMQNVEEFGYTDEMMGVSASGFAQRAMGLDTDSHHEWESTSGSQAEEDPEDGDAEDRDSWDSDMLQDMDDLSTSSDVMDTVERILSKRTRKGGLQYLCVYEGSVTDDARWLPATYLTSDPEKKLIRSFEEELYMRKLEPSNSESSDDADDTEDDEELDDETIARVLQKQEELGLGSDEVLLYGGDEYFGGAGSTKAAFDSYYGKPSKRRSGQPRGRGKRDRTFPSASAMADALAMDPYGGFDIMDTERPSLKPKKKGRRGQPPPELEDPDLNYQMQNAWEADRVKKRLKKAEREELRQQGLLGRKSKAPNLAVKYKGGLDMDDVLEEIREFMVGDMKTLSLPPMEAHRRATIHQAAKMFELTSRSRGDGQERFTVLSKTTRTRLYSDDEFDQAIQRKGFRKRLQGSLPSKKGSARASTFRSGPRARPQVGYRDGDKVGANAPELGPENKGHALMMKMGWSKGMALGTMDNQGILHPIAHTVKTNKAGLQ